MIDQLMAKLSVLIIHGGAGPIKKGEYPRYQEGVESVLRAVSPALAEGASAVDAVERAVMLLEEHPQFNAGIGSALREDGSVRMDASIMDGSRFICGAVGCVRNLLHPVCLARRVMEATPHILLVGEEANAFARAQGFEEVPEERLITARRRERWKKEKARRMSARRMDRRQGASTGTVGAVALDREGKLAAATSTGGSSFSHSARVGDTAIIGAGTFADEIAAVSATGLGEPMIKVNLCRSCAVLIRDGLAPQQAAEKALALLAKRTGHSAGLIVIDAQGRIGVAYNTKRMAYGRFAPSEGIVLPPLV